MIYRMDTVRARALASSLAAGVLVLALTPWGPGDTERFGGGWRSLLDGSPRRR